MFIYINISFVVGLFRMSLCYVLCSFSLVLQWRITFYPLNPQFSYRTMHSISLLILSKVTSRILTGTNLPQTRCVKPGSKEKGFWKCWNKIKLWHKRNKTWSTGFTQTCEVHAAQITAVIIDKKVEQTKYYGIQKK